MELVSRSATIRGVSDKTAVVRKARREGLLDGMASVIYVFGPARPAPPRVRRSAGSLASDMRELRRDIEQLVDVRG